MTAEPEGGGTVFGRDAELRQENWSLGAKPPRSGGEPGGGLDESGLPVIPAPAQRPFGLRNLVQPPRHDANPGQPLPRRHAFAEEEAAPATSSAVSAQPDAQPVPRPVQGQPVETGAEHRATAGKDSFEQHQNAWSQRDAHVQARAEQERPVDFGGAQDSSAVTSVQSGAAVLDHHAETDGGATEAQAATDFAVPDEVVNVDVRESGDTATMGAAGAVTGQAMKLANADDEYRSPGARGYHGGDGFFGDRREEGLPGDHKSVLARWALWLREQPDLFPSRRLAANGEPKYLLARHIDSEGLDRTYVYSNLGPGVIAKRLPVRAWPGWEHAADPGVHTAALGNEDLVFGAKRHFEQQRDLFAAHGLAYSLAGMAVTYRAEEFPRRAIQDCNNHLTGSQAVEAPFLVEAAGPLVEPEGGSAHPLQYFARDLHNRITELLAGPWAEEARTRALTWVSEIVDGSGAQNWDGFTRVQKEIANQRRVSWEAYGAACADGEQLAATAWRNLAQARALPEPQRNPAIFRGFLAFHRALIGLSALERWGQAQVSHDPGFACDLAYLALRAREEEGDRELPARMIAQLPDPQESYWKPR
ncbi:hypothetical protein Srot_0800 [Segniliparus rotundus DSM 44985]|uniref:Uncharacterized protein n=1 Tax=Segniliparus rotundus (strain ATCC BAA-972 / CDC 1076 / CIP 108378 / DSM 44985 / JCM 13578) TaxID=640132 RepID=D6ZDZ9_SEGRD|nr:hypothetical protein [Segniliparus rotundus]ADG97279.1 hypothetical protein Srot_0800 [Segniliparus rotundus DSM 44985]